MLEKLFCALLSVNVENKIYSVLNILNSKLEVADLVSSYKKLMV